MKTSHIEDLGSLLHIKIPVSKTNKQRSFTVLGEVFLDLYRKYAALRPLNMAEDRFFIKYGNGKCFRSVMGIHKIAAASKDVATFLGLPNPEQFTGHCLRRTSATLLVDAGGDLTLLKRHGGWKSSNVAEGYIEESLQNKKNIAIKILTPTATKTSRPPINENVEDIEIPISEENLNDPTVETTFKSTDIVPKNDKKSGVDEVNTNHEITITTDMNTVLKSHGLNIRQPTNCNFVFNIYNK